MGEDRTRETQDAYVPPTTWPTSGSGFEADPFSPAGSAQREGVFFAGLARRRHGRLVLWALVAMMAVPALVGLVAIFVHR